MILHRSKRMAFLAVGLICACRCTSAAAQTADFVGSIAPPQQRVMAGETASYTITVTSINGFVGTIQFSAAGLPPGATVSFAPSTLTGSGAVTASITTSRGTPRGAYQILLSGSSGNIIHTGGVFLNVGPPGYKFGDFGGSVSPAYQTIAPGESAGFSINVFPIDGFRSDVSLSVTGLPPGATATFDPAVIEDGSGNSTLNIVTSGSTPTSSYHLTVTATGGDRTHTNGMNLNVGPPGTDFTDFGGFVDPAYQTVQPGGSTSFTVGIFPLNGFNSDVSLSLNGLPPGATAAFNPPVIPGGSGESTLTITTASTTATATYHLTITGTGGGHTHTNGMNLNVGPPGTDFTDYTGSIAPSSQTERVGKTAQFTVMILLLNGTGCVSLQVSGLPPEAIGAFNPTSEICGSPASTVFTITTTHRTPPGTYTLTFQGTTTGGFVHDGSVTLTLTRKNGNEHD